MNILGINCFSHDTSACLLKDGQIIAFAEEERFNREKHTRDFPDRAIKFCLDEAGIEIDEVDYLGFPFRPGLDLSRGLVDFVQGFPWSYRRFVGQLIFDAALFKKVFDFKSKYGYQKKIIFVGHHEAHCASSFFVSPFEEAAILSIDRGGDYLSTYLAAGRGNDFQVVKYIKNPNSLGSVYTTVTSYLGFKPNSDEGKVMGLAPYGRPTYLADFQNLIHLDNDGAFKINLSYFTYHRLGGYGVSQKFVNKFGPAREPESKLDSRHEDLAWALQKVTEDAAVHLADYLYRKVKSNNLCLTGGVALNSVMNATILEKTPFREVFIQPSANDAGTSLGAALYIWHKILGNPRNFEMRHAYFGPAFSNDEIEKTLVDYKVKFNYVKNPAKRGAELIAQSKILGWLQGRMEVGPRALGNRSILADPRLPEMKDILNQRVKHREGFRPFAPSVIEEEAEDYFENYYPSPFMLLVSSVKQEKRREVPAICHVDGTGRPQTVHPETNPLYWELISEFKKLTDVPMVLNTSFNVRGEPIVCTPGDALKCFLSTQMDALIMGNYLVEKNHKL